MNQPCNSQYNAPCPTCFNKSACYPLTINPRTTPVYITPESIENNYQIAPDIIADAEKTLFALFQISQDGDDYPVYDLLGVYDSISAAGHRITGLYTIIDRETLELTTRSPFRDDIPYDYIIEPMRVNQPVKSSSEIAALKYPNW